MEELYLTRPDETLLEEIRGYRDAMQTAGSSMDGTSGLQNYDDPLAWLAHVRMLESKETCPSRWVTATLYVAVRRADGRIVGMIDLRHELNAHLAAIGGHIGYSVRPEERRKGYARWMLAQVLEKARARGIPWVLITCDDDNEGSRRTIEDNGGVLEGLAQFEGETIRRYWIAL